VVHHRNPKLIQRARLSKRDEEALTDMPASSATDENYDEVIKALKTAGIDPVKLAEALAKSKN